MVVTGMFVCVLLVSMCYVVVIGGGFGFMFLVMFVLYCIVVLGLIVWCFGLLSCNSVVRGFACIFAVLDLVILAIVYSVLLLRLFSVVGVAKVYYAVWVVCFIDCLLVGCVDLLLVVLELFMYFSLMLWVIMFFVWNVIVWMYCVVDGDCCLPLGLIWKFRLFMLC